jgi:hypothetical protein
MKMKKLVFLSTLALILAFFVGSAMAGPPSAKFAATWGTERFNVVSVAETDDPAVTAFDSKTGHTLATIKVPQDKELLVGLSAEIGLYTDTSIKGKEGGEAKALAGAGAHVYITAEPVDGYNGTYAVAAPGGVVLSARFQELSATLGGVLQACIDEGTWSVTSDGTCTETCYEDCNADILVVEECDGENSCTDGQTTIPCDCYFTDEEIGLLQKTLAAHHFNFVLPNMDQGVYNIKAYFTTAAVADVYICDGTDDPDNPCGEGTAEASAVAKAGIGKYMMTIQQVRAVNDPDALQETDIIEP